MEKIFTVRLSADEKAVEILDQTLLPNRVEYLRWKLAEQICEAIYELRVRGAPAIGVCAGFGMYVIAQRLVRRYPAGTAQGRGLSDILPAHGGESQLGC